MKLIFLNFQHKRKCPKIYKFLGKSIKIENVKRMENTITQYEF